MISRCPVKLLPRPAARAVWSALRPLSSAGCPAASGSGYPRRSASILRSWRWGCSRCPHSAGSGPAASSAGSRPVRSEWSCPPALPPVLPHRSAPAVHTCPCWAATASGSAVPRSAGCCVSAHPSSVHPVPAALAFPLLPSQRQCLRPAVGAPFQWPGHSAAPVSAPMRPAYVRYPPPIP